MGFNPLNILGIPTPSQGSGLIGKITGSTDAAQAMKDAATDAARAQVAAAEKNIDFQKWLWGEQKALAQPYADAGTRALSQYEELAGDDFTLDDLYMDPGYQFGLNEGTRARENAASSKGMQLSGAQQKAMQRYGTDYASTKYNEAFNRRQTQLDNLYRMIASGQGAAAGQAAAGVPMGSQISSSITGSGDALANMYQQQGMATAGAAMAPWQATMDVGNLFASFLGAGGKMSDRRVKENIRQIGKLPSGIKVYEYNYIWSGDKEIGVIAQEVLPVIPEAVGERNGYMTVDYSRLH